MYIELTIRVVGNWKTKYNFFFKWKLVILIKYLCYDDGTHRLQHGVCVGEEVLTKRTGRSRVLYWSAVVVVVVLALLWWFTAQDTTTSRLISGKIDENNNYKLIQLMHLPVKLMLIINVYFAFVMISVAVGVGCSLMSRN